MVLLAKSIALCPDIPDHKIVLVTDRVDLDDQIYKTFHHCGKELEQAKTGKHLLEMLKGNKQRIVTTIIDKFEAAVGRHTTVNDDPNIFVLVGFDAPRNTILYLCRKLKDHTLLQAIARVNRLCEGKEFGYILDYRGVLENLDHALDLYSTLPEFNAKDIADILTDVCVETTTLPQKHSLLWESFKEVRNHRDEEEYEQLLADEALRTRFYERLSAYSRTLAIAVSSIEFLEETPPEW